MSGRVFIDTSAYYALMDSDAAENVQTQRTFQRLLSGNTELFSTTFVVAEIHALVLARAYRDLAARTLEGLYASSIRIIRPTERDETRAREIIRLQSDKDYSFTDAISFAVMERLHIRHAWTYDHHFDQFGWQLEP
jgi:uncharacterized protein